MRHPFPIREIARQAGVSEATVDRVLNQRPGVRAGTVLQVERAVDELERQRTQLRLSERTFMVDVVMDTPKRFSTLVRRALERELPTLGPAVLRSRFHVGEHWDITELVRRLDAIARSGSHAVVLKAPDVPEVAAAIGRLTAARIPVITLVTDVPASTRIAHVGMDDRAAGATAAYLVHQVLGTRPGAILVVTSSELFRGEEERERGFRTALGHYEPDRVIVDIPNSDGLDDTCRTLVSAALATHPDIVAVYSIGGGNSGIATAFAAAGRTCAAFVGHDLAPANRELLIDGRMTAVLHHDLAADMRQLARMIMVHHGALPGPLPKAPSAIQVITPHNLPVY